MGRSGWLKGNWDKAAVALLSAYFLFQLLFLSLHVPSHVFPDEERHLARCVFQSKSLLFPAESSESSSEVSVKHRPPLYYFLMGKLLMANFLDWPPRLFLRLISSFFGLLTVLYGWRWIRLFSTSRLVHVLFVLMLTNTLMFTAICSTVSYDPLVNLVACMSIYYLTSYFLQRERKTLIILLVCLLIGPLIKQTFLPFAFICLLSLAILERSQLNSLPQTIRRCLFPRRLPGFLAGCVLLVLLLLNGLLYGGNVLLFGKLIPSAEDLWTPEEIMSNSAFARNMIVKEFREGKTTYSEAVTKAGRIEHIPARKGTIFLLNVHAHRRQSGVPFKPISRFYYAFPWAWQMAMSTFGVMGHTSFYHDDKSLAVYCLILLAALAMLIRHWKPTLTEDSHSYIMAIVLFYTLVLMQLVNYQSYLQMELIGVALQGRYLFVVLVPLYGLVAHYLLNHLSQPFRILAFVGVGAFFLYAGFPFFLEEAKPILALQR